MSEENGTKWTDKKNNVLLASAGILTIGLIAGGYLLGDGLLRAKMADRSVTVRGLAEREVTADLATWTIARPIWTAIPRPSANFSRN